MARRRAPAARTRTAPTARAGTVRLEVRTPGGTVTLAAADAPEAARLGRRIEAWMRGTPDAFEDIATPPGTPFQRACWEACRTIPRGQTRTYAWLAAAAGSPRAGRAAGQARRRNPRPSVIPCHRVVGSGGWIGGYAGDSGPDAANLRVKRALLELEAPGADVPSRAPRGRAAAAH